MGTESTPATATGTAAESSTTTTTTVAVGNDDNDDTIINNIDREVIAEAYELAKVIHQSANVLLDRLLSNLSNFPEFPATPSDEDGDDDDLPLVDHHEGEEDHACNERIGTNCDNYDDDDDEEEEEEEEETTRILERGLTLPVSAVAWLSDQLDALDKLQNHQTTKQQQQQTTTPLSSELPLESQDDDEAGEQQPNNNNFRRPCTTTSSVVCDLEPWLGTEAAKSLRYRLNLLRFLLPRAKLIRLTRQSWPPTRSTTKDDNLIPSFLCLSHKQKLKKWKWWRKRQRRGRRSTSSTMESENAEAEASNRASEFVRHAVRYQHGASNCVNLWKVFPNATVLVLESIPPSWIDLTGRAKQDTVLTTPRSYHKQLKLRLISVTNAAIYDLKAFLPPSAVSNSLMHLKLDNCSLGELTTGFSSTLGKLVRLEHLSLRNNQFRSSKTLLRGLRPLTRLRYLDVSSNQLVGCFGPYANLCLGGQVRILKLSNNLLETCFKSGLEKCYGLEELWLDSNNIQDVSEVSGLSRLPNLQCLALQRNPFSTKKSTTTTSSSSSSKFSSLSSSSFTNKREILPVNHHFSGNNSNSNSSTRYENPYYDPNWKIRLWTWFQHERRALTPLELPLLNKKTKHFGANHRIVSAVGRMTRKEWDRIQEESFSIATTTVATASTASTISSTTTSTSVVSTTTPCIGETTEQQESRMTVMPAIATKKTSTPLLLEPVRNRRVTKKANTRQVRIDASDTSGNEDNRNGGPSFQTLQTQRKPNPKKRSKKSTKPKILSIENSNASNKNTIFDEKVLPSQLSFSLQDVLVSIHHENIQQHHPSEIETKAIEDLADEKENEADRDDTDKETKTPGEASVECTAENDVPSNPFLEDDSSSQDDSSARINDSKDAGAENPIVREATGDEKINETEGDENANEVESSEPVVLPVVVPSLEAEEVKGDGVVQSLNDEEAKVKENESQQPKAESKPPEKHSTTSSPKSSPKRSPRRTPKRSPRRPEPIDEDRIFVRPKVASVKLNQMGNYKPFDALSSDWDDLIKKASEGRIPDGLLKSPVEESSDDFGMNNDVFSDQAADLLGKADANNPTVAKSADQTPGSISTSDDPTKDPSLSSNNRLTNSLPEHVWQDDDSVLSSLGASRDDILPRRVNKFQLAEENCAYDGPDSSRGMKVVENKQLYFESFVFPTSMPDLPAHVLEEMEEDQDDWQLITMFYPRIQLWPDDWRVVELERVRMTSSMHSSADWTTNRERVLRVWEEDIVPCGKPAMRRLPPNRKNRLGFHGDKLFENADIDAYAECRKVLLCLSSKALYVILERDDVTKSHKQQSKKRRFPLPLDRGDRFRDAPWPHAVARHSLGDLEAICIGFEFQRLTLRFRNQSLPKSDPFVYVLLTGDKKSSVRIFQEIQKLSKDFADNHGVNLGKKPSPIEIENDAQVVLDSLHGVFGSTDSSAAAQTIGTIMHFQIVQQQWKHGDRGTVRRVCVITDTNILLLDEDYAADGHDLSSITVKGKNMADARYRLVDHAALSLVSQVQAANADPRAITIIINPSTLSRTKRWRLICRDREGAERLVDDARKALEDI